MLEQLKAKQAKSMMQQMIAAGQTEEVVDLLTAMNLRKAGSILREFKSEAEIAQANELLKHLRGRGVDLMTSAASALNGDAS